MCMPNISTAAKLLLTLMALLLLSTPISAEIDNCCFVGRQCDADRDWVNGYWAYQNNQCAAPSQQQQARSSQSQPQTGTSAAVDNCCFVDRLCTTGEDWVNGYWAYQYNQCAAPSQQQQARSSQPQVQTETSAAVDNCCFVDRLCTTGEEWVSGYWAYQNNQCSAPSRQQQPRSSQSQPQTKTSEAVNNCCFIGWLCDADEEWTSGYFAFQHDQCEAPSQWQSQWQQMNQQQLHEQQGQRRSGSQQAQAKEERLRPPALEQNRGDPPAANRNSATVGEKPGTYQATLDLSNPQDTNHKLEDGANVYIRRRHVTREEQCAAYPDWCERNGF